MSDELVETVARRLWWEWHSSVRRLPPPFPGDIPTDPDRRDKERWLAMAKGAIAAVEEARKLADATQKDPDPA